MKTKSPHVNTSKFCSLGSGGAARMHSLSKKRDYDFSWAVAVLLLTVSGTAISLPHSDIYAAWLPTSAGAPGQLRGQQERMNSGQPEIDKALMREPEIVAMQAPDPAAAVLRLVDAEYLSASERAELRVRHGVWSDADLTTPVLTAAAMATSGNFAHDIFDGESPQALLTLGVNAEDLAEVYWRRGQLREALGALTNITTSRGMRIAGEVKLELGDTAGAVEILRVAARRVGDINITSGDELAESVRAAMLLSRWDDPASEGAQGTVFDHQSLLTALGRARDELQRLSWRTAIAEAWLLYERDKYEDASKAVQSALELNPTCADAWYLLGLMSVDTFDFPRAQRIAARLDLLAMGDSGALAEGKEANPEEKPALEAPVDPPTEENAKPAPPTPKFSPFASVIRAYIMLRQSEGGQALAELKRDLTAFPLSRVLLQHQAAATAATFDFERTEALLKDYDVISPLSPLAYLAVGKAMGDSRQYEEAAKYLRIAAQRAPRWAEPVIQLGLTEFQAGRNDEATTALEQGSKLDPANNRAANSLLLLQELAGYTSMESAHFIVRCKPGVDEVVAAEMLGPLEEIFERVTGNRSGGIQHAPSHKTVVELYPNHRWFGVRITGMPALHTIAAATGPVIAMEAPREGAGHMGTFDWKRVVQHEYTHTVTLSRTKNRLPHWFTEASAVYLEDAPRDFSTVRLLTMAYETGRIFDLDTINIMFVRPKRPTDRSQAYAQGHLMYQFMIERFGPEVPLRLMDLYATGVREQDAFQRVMGVGREEFMVRFREYFGEHVERWGMKSSDLDPTVATLLKREAAEKPEVKPEGAVESQAVEGATLEQLRKWVEGDHAKNPFVLAELCKQLLAANGGRTNAELVPMLEAYAAARPTDPMPHKALAAWYLSVPGASRAIEHLEYLDIREQNSPGFAQELSRQYEAGGDMPKAAAKAARAVQIAPYNAAIREEATRIAVKMKDFTTARRHLVALTKLEPERADHVKRLAALEAIMAK
jgi:tetratricopeptide (TPR) repeat protein